MILQAAEAADAPTLAEIHGAGFDRGWSADDIATLLEAAGGYGFLVRDPGDPGSVRGFILARALAGEAEILTVTVGPGWRRRGLARALVEAAANAARTLAAEALFLEVAADNGPAIALYRQAGFEPAGRRPGYYRRPGAPAVDALVLRLPLNSGGA